jgi:hypothetical protein
MRKWLSAVAVVATLGFTGTALAETPAQVYSDFAADGVLGCGHSRGALEGVLKDASLHQYGDPYTLLGLKLAVRKQLAGGCRRTTQAAATSVSGGDAAQEPDPQAPAGGSTPAPERPPATAETDQGSESSAVGGEVRGQPEDSRDGRILLVGVLLLLLALASGGWAAKRAYTDRG